MSKIYVAGHPGKRFDNDFSYLSLSPKQCVTCGGRVDGINVPLEYYWDTEFQSEQAQHLDDRQVFWGNFLLIVPKSVHDELQSISAFDFFETSPVETELDGRELIVHPLEKPSEAYYWAKPKYAVVARVSGSQNSSCPDCGFFVDHPRQLTRLIVDRDDIPSSGIFSIVQNRSPQIFVTEDAKQRLSSFGIPANFYPAGQIEERL